MCEVNIGHPKSRKTMKKCLNQTNKKITQRKSYFTNFKAIF